MAPQAVVQQPAARQAGARLAAAQQAGAQQGDPVRPSGLAPRARAAGQPVPPPAGALAPVVGRSALPPATSVRVSSIRVSPIPSSAPTHQTGSRAHWDGAVEPSQWPQAIPRAAEPPNESDS